MELIISDSYEQMSKRATADLVTILQSAPSPLLCPASGDSPKGIYKEIINMVQEDKLDISKWKYVGLDEWVGLNGQDEGSCRYHLNNDLFSPLGITEDRICFFDGRATDLEGECRKTDQYIQDGHGIDVAIVGLGMNGHVGMNEPGVDPALHAHIIDLDEVTKTVGQKYFSAGQSLSKGITLGIASLMDARYVFLVVSGKKKAGIVKQALYGEISNTLPASLLRDHPGFRVYLDKDAAGG